MNSFSTRVMQAWARAGTRFLPFADAASPDLPLGRLLRLSLFQVSVGMALVLLMGTLNRVMIVELAVPSWLVGVMVALPIVFAPFRALIGFRSDVHRSRLGWKRVPFIWKGTLLQFGGLAIMPFALIVLGGLGESANAPVWLGRLGAGLAFLLVGAGVHMTQTVGLALATDLAPVENQPKVVGLMYVVLLLGMLGSALVFGSALADFTPGGLVRVIQGAALATMVLNVIALWKQEPRRPTRGPVEQAEPSFIEAWYRFSRGAGATRRLVLIALGTMAFGMADILLEPYGGQVLRLTVGSTTKLTATLSIGGLISFGLASRVLSRGADPYRVAAIGAWVGVPGFLGVILAASLGSTSLFTAAIFAIGFAGGLFSHGTLTATMQSAAVSERGLALGAWGAAQATAAGVGVALSGILRDVVSAATANRWPALGYIAAFTVEVVLLVVTLVTVSPLVRRRSRAATPAPMLTPSDLETKAC